MSSRCCFKLKARFFFLLGLFLVLAFTGCSDNPNPGSGETPSKSSGGSLQPVFGKTYRRAFYSPILTLDPAFIGDSFSHEVSRQIFDGLVEIDRDAKVAPAIAESWSISQDRLTYTFKLRPNCRFHATSGLDDKPTANGGRAITADDVAYTFKRLLAPESHNPRGKTFWVIKGAQAFSEGTSPNLEGLVVISTDTLSLTIEKPFAPFISLLALSNAFILPREDVEAPGSVFASAPVGAGPFIWAGKKGETISLRVNPNYYQGRAYLDRLEFPVIPDEKERFAAFKRHELSENDVPDPEYKNVKSDPALSPYLYEVSRWGNQYLGFNTASAPFDNVKVRQAFNYSIDAEAIVKLILNDRAKVAHGILPPGIPAFNTKLKGYTYDLAKAKTLLAEAGYPDGKGFPPIILQINRDQTHSRIGEFVLANLRDLNIPCTLKEIEFAEHIQMVEKGMVPFFRMGWNVDYPDPDGFLYPLFHSDNIGAAGNFSRYNNPQVDQLLERARFEVDVQTRNSLYQQAEQLIVNDAPWIFLYHFTTHILCQPEVKGMELTPMGLPFRSFRKIWLAN